jgi:hypothetical protein
MGKCHIAAICQTILLMAFIPIGYIIVVSGKGGIYAAGQVSLYF